jgi:hypothetical protein
MALFGFIFDPELSFGAHIQWWCNKANSTLRAMRMLGNSVRGMTPKDKRLLYLTVILGTLNYRRLQDSPIQGSGNGGGTVPAAAQP